MYTPLAIAVAAILVLTTQAEAKRRHVEKVATTSEFCGDRYCPGASIGQPSEENAPTRRGRRAAITGDVTVIGGPPAGCPPTRYCGCATGKKLRGHIVRSDWPSATWGRMPQVSPAAGTACWRPGHVKAIVGGGPGAWQIYDPNSGGHLTRTYTSNLSECRKIVSPHGSASLSNAKMASTTGN